MSILDKIDLTGITYRSKYEQYDDDDKEKKNKEEEAKKNNAKNKKQFNGLSNLNSLKNYNEKNKC
mgnify:CR=1 FL=1